MTADQLDRIPAVVVGPPRFIGVVGSLRSNGRIAPGRCLLGGHGTGSPRIEHHTQAGLPDPAEEVEVLQPEEPVGVGKDPGVENSSRDKRGPPTGHVHRQKIRPVTGGNDVDRVGASPDEFPTVSDDGPDTVARRAEVVHPLENTAHPGCGQWEESDVVFAQIGPLCGRPGESLFHPRSKSACRPQVARESNHLDFSLESRIVEPADPVDHHDDLMARQALDTHQRANGITSKTRPHEGEHHRGDVLESSCLSGPGTVDRSLSIAHRPVTALGYQRSWWRGTVVRRGRRGVRRTKEHGVSRSVAGNSLRHGNVSGCVP